MHFFTFLAAFLLIRRIQKALKFTAIGVKWNTIFNIASISVGVFFFILAKISNSSIAGFVGAATLGYVLYFINKEEDFKSFRGQINTHIPLIATTVVTGLVSLIANDFFDEYRTYFTFAMTAAFIWVFARQANSKKQDEALRIAAERKAELEALVAERTLALTQQKNELEELVEELRTTQAQLIQAEKMASLGELTAGIAHEIQNPLNFVNNFSEVSMELLDEMEEELARGDREEAAAIASDIKQNLEKIGFHGKRADSIVKGMLQHSRASTGQKELTDINALADEYLRLSYHGLRAKDKSFNAELITQFDPAVPPVDAVQQDIGRVVLNLFNNAFYAVQQKQKTGGAQFKPTVKISTKAVNEGVEIRIEDNGIGIPDAIREKIMQPFFTTKPTGEGTGLGLSLSYDIIVKGHGGKIDIDSKEGEYTVFAIYIPA
jgi:two-component system NtrC family sensor kinase